MNVGELSTLLVWAAGLTYTIALVAYTTVLARIAEARPRAAKTAVAAVAPAAAPIAVGVGRTAVLERPVGGAPAAGSGTGSTPDGAVVVPATGRRAAGIARSMTYLGLLFGVVAVVLRGIAAGRWPTANMYEFTLVGSTMAIAVLVLVQRRNQIPFLGVLVTGAAALALFLGVNVFYIRAEGVQPALQSYWLIIHVGVAITSSGIFAVAAATSVLQLMRARREGGSTRLAGRRWGWIDTVPDSRSLEALSFRLNAIGFVLWTFTLIAGSIWAEHAWGRYWGWDPKEIGTFVVWVVYAAYLHARTTRGWAGSRAAYFVLVGFTAVIANFTVINLFVTGRHSYSGI
jgi:cytochrome c-type biogenesis protein CcsB